MHVAYARGIARGVKQERCRDVVRQVAHQAHAGRKTREVELERVGAMHRQLGWREARGKRRGEIAIDLDRLELARPLDEPRGQPALAGADLDQEIIRRWRDCVDDARQHTRVVQEMLTETLPRTMPGLVRVR